MSSFNVRINNQTGENLAVNAASWGGSIDGWNADPNGCTIDAYQILPFSAQLSNGADSFTVELIIAGSQVAKLVITAAVQEGQIVVHDANVQTSSNGTELPKNTLYDDYGAPIFEISFTGFP